MSDIMDLRLIVCGTRTWSGPERVGKAIVRAWTRLAPNCPAEGVTIIHGACPTGADDMADRWARDMGMAIERHPADWKTHGLAAGPRRNEEMAKSGADHAIAFWDGESRGTLDMVRRCVRSGITVTIVPPGERDRRGGGR